MGILNLWMFSARFTFSKLLFTQCPECDPCRVSHPGGEGSSQSLKPCVFVSHFLLTLSGSSDHGDFRFKIPILSIKFTSHDFWIIFVFCSVNRIFLKTPLNVNASLVFWISKSCFSFLPSLIVSCFQFVLERFCETWTLVYAVTNSECVSPGIIALKLSLWHSNVDCLNLSPLMPSAHFSHVNWRCHYLNLATSVCL